MPEAPTITVWPVLVPTRTHAEKLAGIGRTQRTGVQICARGQGYLLQLPAFTEHRFNLHNQFLVAVPYYVPNHGIDAWQSASYMDTVQRVMGSSGDQNKRLGLCYTGVFGKRRILLPVSGLWLTRLSPIRRT